MACPSSTSSPYRCLSPDPGRSVRAGRGDGAGVEARRHRDSASLVVADRDRWAAESLRLAWEDGVGGVWAGVAGSVVECRRICGRMRPGLLLVSGDLPGGCVWECTRRIGTDLPGGRIAVLLTEPTEVDLVRAWQVKPAAVLLREEISLGGLVAALRVIGSGRRVVSPRVAVGMRKLAQDAGSWHRVLSARDQQLLDWFATARNDAAIGERLGLSVHSVRTFRQRLISRLDLHSTVELIRWARTRGFGRRVEE
jgi:DNA-binding NarL/FixJ family response regulator